MIFFKNKSSGSATLEYVFITIFGLILTTGAMKILHSLYINKLSKINQELQLDLDMDSLKIDGFFWNEKHSGDP